MKPYLLLIDVLVVILVACTPTAPIISTTTPNTVSIPELANTATAIPTAISVTASPPVFIVDPTPWLTPIPPTVISPYEAEHEAIRKVIAAYFDKIYSMHNSFRVDGFDDTVSNSTEAAGFLKTELRKQAVTINWARLNLLRYASYSYTLDYSEIVVFDSGQRARANFTEGNEVVYELSIPSGIISRMANVKHIIILGYEQNGWKIIYDVHDDYSHRSLYAPTPFPKDVLNELDKQLIGLNQGQGGPVLPKAGKSFISPDPAQLDRWKEYQTALAEKLMPQYPRDKVLCEWELTKKYELRINVWAVCMTTVTSAEVGNYYFPVASVPAVINLDVDGTVQSVEIPEYGESYLSDFWKLFPNGAWNDLPDVSAMEKHLHWRRINRTEPPLVVLNAIAILTATPAVSPTP